MFFVRNEVLRVSYMICQLVTGNELDAINCALVAKDYASGSYLAIGDPSETLMILSRPKP